MSERMNKKKIGIFIGIAMGIILFLLAALYGYRHYQIKRQVQERNQKGILLAFDDYNPDSWQEHFDLFDEYGVKVTFFVNLKKPDAFCAEAEKRGHEIGFHTAEHAKLTEVSEEEFYEQAIAPIENFRSEGYELTSFAYPFGYYEEWMNEELLKYYKTLRGAWHFQGCYKEMLRGGFIEAYSIDNLHFESDEHFREEIGKLLDVLKDCDDGTVASLFSHAISGGDWCITADRLEILFQEAKKRDLVFYTFRELQ